MKHDRVTEQTKLGLWGRLKRLALTDVGAMVRGFNAADLEAVERLLLEADFGVPATMDLMAVLEDGVRRGRWKSEADLRDALVDRIADLLAPAETSGEIARAESGPTVVLVMGVNGVGKTTTVAKLAHRLTRQGRKVLLAAADTWRAGAIAQLEVWATRLGVPCVSGASGEIPRRWHSMPWRRPARAAPTPCWWIPPDDCTPRKG